MKEYPKDVKSEGNDYDYKKLPRFFGVNKLTKWVERNTESTNPIIKILAYSIAIFIVWPIIGFGLFGLLVYLVMTDSGRE